MAYRRTHLGHVELQHRGGRVPPRKSDPRQLVPRPIHAARELAGYRTRGHGNARPHSDTPEAQEAYNKPAMQELASRHRSRFPLRYESTRAKSRKQLRAGSSCIPFGSCSESAENIRRVRPKCALPRPDPPRTKSQGAQFAERIECAFELAPHVQPKKEAWPRRLKSSQSLDERGMVLAVHLALPLERKRALCGYGAA
jgi:hypothetical protein